MQHQAEKAEFFGRIIYYYYISVHKIERLRKLPFPAVLAGKYSNKFYSVKLKLTPRRKIEYVQHYTG